MSVVDDRVWGLFDDEKKIPKPKCVLHNKRSCTRMMTDSIYPDGFAGKPKVMVFELYCAYQPGVILPGIGV